MNAGLILAGGTGERLTGYGVPKQFIKVGGRPLLSYCLKTFEQCAGIDLICVVVPEEWREIFGGGYIYADPGKSRQHSIRNGLRALEPHSPRRVIVHDAARPLVTAGDVADLLKAAAGYDGATPALPVTDTVYQSTDGRTITKTFNRDELCAGQTPECYDFRKYLDIHEGLSCGELSGIRGSSEIAVNFGMRIAIFKGNPNNFKVTTNADLERFQAIVSMG